MILVTGDTHGDIDFDKLTIKNMSCLSKADYLIICGDCGVLFDPYEKNKMIGLYSNLPYTVLFVDGNHENFDMLNSYPVEIWNGGKVHKISDTVIHLMRGQVFQIEGLKFFTFGGALSIDRAYRIPYRSWWPEEMPTEEEKDEALKNLKLHNFKVDYVITHDCPASLLPTVLAFSNKGNAYPTKPIPSNTFLEEFAFKLDFSHWFFGHYHIDQSLEEKYTAIYRKILILK